MVAAKQLIPFPKFQNWELGYDSSIVILGDGAISVDGVMVKGSRSFRRDPRLGRLADERYKPQHNRGASRAEITHVPTGMKWCSEHDPLDNRGWVSLMHFSADKRYRDGKNPICKECRARNERRRYALIKEALGETVRGYRRPEKLSA